MQSVQSDIMTHRGSHYDLGVETAKWLQTTPLLKNREKEWRKRNPRFDIDVKETYHIFQTYAPKIWDELIGMQDVLNLPTKQIILNFGHYRFTDLKDSGCTVFKGTDYLIRNYDYHPATYDGRYLLFQPNDSGLAQIGPTSRVTGRMDGMNECGLVMAYNFMHRKKPANGFVCYMIGRLILENCKDVHEAIRLLKEIPHRSSFSYILMDKNLNYAIVEVTPRSINLRYDPICTNHFELLTHENRNYTKESKERLERVIKHTNHTITKEDAFKLFNDPQYEIYSKLFRSWSGTIHTSIYEPNTLTAWMALGENNHATEINFSKWLNGEDLNIDYFRGEIDTSLTFATY
ncbi:Acyl-coenzyme A:6-aminopenicillanic acid acyl-transferase [Staphylococcus caprae M23864:W1]|uniref:C45 family autoproteolytic acyltransferase/hydolase n=1 Tax=Staphylococcus caprae TaxID=29380 RepID=UPI0001AAC965|nr:C45 family autoproteolytic acyltransferase/hydolase [Staphylococcus caprae]EES42155.1 Acyl-coenzyme A:6-aminopenicillanic acid acyl-transferase [Staphylococcus caprae M23864:W1]MBN6826870.1 acyl-CoA--6-aminopenicillanic acid acyltransferase [Staphylococcus caprae]MBX5317154.1 acyl-CoA--6-aminopenicillanic acid acyltransferase [Staphylococcus caprae]MBX5324144.1 acyl-CoA--6-aminopenicillanic acid acyltransferase [Staphylococcus caprae]MDI0015359.1 C45 family autoproteolytic acyltransferase/h